MSDNLIKVYNLLGSERIERLIEIRAIVNNFSTLKTYDEKDTPIILDLADKVCKVYSYTDFRITKDDIAYFFNIFVYKKGHGINKLLNEDNKKLAYACDDYYLKNIVL